MQKRALDFRFYDARSLALHCEIANRLRAHPESLSIGAETHARWSATSPNASTDPEWSALLERGAAAVIEAIEADDERGKRLRQSSPLLGILSFEEQLAIREAFQDAYLCDGGPPQK